MEQNLNEPNPFDDSNYKKGEKFMKLSDSIAEYIDFNGYYGLLSLLPDIQVDAWGGLEKILKEA